ncbi:hypothetical protein BMS3Abin03_01590 [bacterium BMS3Abin03]|nr:hypothetical protein BMS3Abin03_01590 [bacterium BMS3Abin03]
MRISYLILLIFMLLLYGCESTVLPDPSLSKTVTIP